MVKPDRILVACKIYEMELHAVLGPELGGKGIQVMRVDSGLHCDFNRLEKELEKSFAAVKGADDDVRRDKIEIDRMRDMSEDGLP